MDFNLEDNDDDSNEIQVKEKRSLATHHVNGIGLQKQNDDRNINHINRSNRHDTKLERSPLSDNSKRSKIELSESQREKKLPRKLKKVHQKHERGIPVRALPLRPASSLKQTPRAIKGKTLRKQKPISPRQGLKIARKRKPTKNFNCDYEGLGAEDTSNDMVACTPYTRTKRVCHKAFEYMSPLRSKAEQCPNHDDNEPICNVKTAHRYSIHDQIDIQCDPDSCEGEVLLGCVDKDYGIIRAESYWRPFDSVEKLEASLSRIIKENSINGFTSCFLKCTDDDNSGLQPLIFPPIVKKKRKANGDKISINVILEDAISRPHFYRSLPRTVKTLRQLVHTKNSGVKVLDFELVQSYAAYTLSNIRVLFSGEKKTGFTSKRESGIFNMMKSFKDNGYQTLAQEDLCFFDFWGSVLSENYNNKLEPFSDKFKDFYKKYLNATNHSIDNKGLTSLACENLRVHGHGNPFKHSVKSCINGKVITHYMLKYVERFIRGAESKKDNAPAMVYTHLNTGHEKTGERIRVDDVPLAEHIKAMSKLTSTITILLSDHGSKTTEYSISNFYGRLEVSSPIMFMIIPNKVAKRLGKKAMKNLINNQKRLVALIDLHRMLNSIKINEISAPAVNDYRISGLLSPIPLNRTCGDLVGMTNDAYCRCKDWNHFIDTNHQTTRWLSEVALGEINNRISEQFMEGHKTRSIGYGACARFRGKSIEHARQSFDGDYVITTLLLLVVPIYGSSSDERFEVTLNYSTMGQPNVRVIDIVRVSIYGKYESCADKGVDVKLCACAKGVTANSIRPLLSLDALLTQSHFGLKTSIETLPFSSCLILAERSLKKETIDKIQTRFMAFEIANKCASQTFKIKFEGKYRKSKISKKLPVYLTIKPLSVVFVCAVDNAWRYGRFKPKVSLVRGMEFSEIDEDNEI